ncbi:MAG: dihydrofolate reductase family protein [Actinomycetota bacterium]
MERHSARGRRRRRRARAEGTAGRRILKIGTGGSFSRTLLEHRLVDEYLFWLFPVVAGSGERLYDGIDTTDFDLIDVKRLDNGILGLTYVPTTR